MQADVCLFCKEGFGAVPKWQRGWCLVCRREVGPRNRVKAEGMRVKEQVHAPGRWCKGIGTSIFELKRKSLVLVDGIIHMNYK